MIVYKSKLVPKGYAGITLYPFVFLRDTEEEIIKKRGLKGYNKLINHEKIHLAQQLELLVIFFYILYVLNFIFNVIRGSTKAYKDIIFEKEAYDKENDLKYLNKRKFWRWIRYI